MAGQVFSSGDSTGSVAGTRGALTSAGARSRNINYNPGEVFTPAVLGPESKSGGGGDNFTITVNITMNGGDRNAGETARAATLEAIDEFKHNWGKYTKEEKLNRATEKTL